MSVEAIVEPKLLVWARVSAGFDIESAAKKAQVKPERLESWERGEARPTIRQLRDLGRVYKRPIAVFYLPEPPREFQPIRDFRRLPVVVAGSESPALRLEIRQAHNRREQALELLELMDIEPEGFKLSAKPSDDPEDVASSVRGFLGIKYEDQVHWNPNRESFNAWRSALERAGVLVFQAMDVDLHEMRGFSITDARLPAVVVNVKDYVRGRVFTMLHELSHIMLGESGLCDLHEESHQVSTGDNVEVFCNRVAGAVFVPRRELLREEEVISTREQRNWTDEHIQKLADRYGASREVVLRRLLICGRVTEAFYQAKRVQLQEEFKVRVAHSRGFAPPHILAVSRAGRSFVKLVLNSYQQDKITASDVADLLEVRLKHLERIQALVSSASP